jgi:hypothetical protein
MGELTGEFVKRDVNGILVMPGGPFCVGAHIHHDIHGMVPECGAGGCRRERTGWLVEEEVGDG